MFDNQNRGPDPNAGIPPYNMPPQGPYGTPPPYGYNIPPGEPYSAPPPYGYNMPLAEPLPLGVAIRQLPEQYIRVLTKPGAETFAMEQGKAAWDIIWVQMLIYGVISALAVLLQLIFSLPGTLATSNIPSQTIAAITSFSVGIALSFIVLAPLGLFIGIGIYHLIAKAFGGQGSFKAYYYSYLLFGVPLGVLSSLLTLIPIAGSFLTLPVWVYQIVLQVFMTMAVHRLSGGKATFAVLILPIAALVLACVLAGIIIAVIAASGQGR
ncbi:MAG TPA: YIP1 family protein [Ktedonobacteraceae bacterium]|nr:YIP1 family protein [Ktedonobacteraceae bacterium]